MNVTDDVIYEALDLAADHRPASQTDWDRLKHRLGARAATTRRHSPRWMLPALAGAAAAAIAVTAVVLGAQFAAPGPAGPASGRLTVVSSPAPAFACTAAGAMTDVAARIPGATELGKPIDVGLHGSTFCAAFAEGYATDVPLAPSGPLRAFVATGGVNNVTVGVVDGTATAITFTPSRPGQPTTDITTVVDLGHGLYGFYVPVHEDGTVTVHAGAASVVSTNVVAIHGDPAAYGAATAGPSPSAPTSPAPAPTSASCTVDGRLTDASAIRVSASKEAQTTGSARIGYEYLPDPTGTPMQCLLIDERGRNFAGRTNSAPSGILQYAGTVAGAHGTYQFVAATGIATSITITRTDGSTTTLPADALSQIRNGFNAAVIYTPNGNPLIARATAYDNGRELNTIRLP